MSPPDPVVHVIDDDEPVRLSLALLLTSAGFRAQTYNGPEAFLEADPTPAPGCVITDMRMPQMNGLELLIHLRARGLAQPVILITGHGDVALAVEAMKQGAVDFFEKPFEEAAMITAVQNALDAAPNGFDREGDGRDARKAVATLSARETDVLVGLVAGKTNKMIARDLGISARTVEDYRAKVMTKLGVCGLSALLKVALRAGF